MSDRAGRAVDTSVIVAALLSWHEQHAAGLRALQHALDRKALVVPAPALIEAYSVMTRLPAPHRINPQDAHALLHETFGGAAHVVALTPPELWRFLRSLPAAGTAGGRTYDAHILACAVKAGATALWTFNERDFVAINSSEIEIVNPAQ